MHARPTAIGPRLIATGNTSCTRLAPTDGWRPPQTLFDEFQHLDWSFTAGGPGFRSRAGGNVEIPQPQSSQGARLSEDRNARQHRHRRCCVVKYNILPADFGDVSEYRIEIREPHCLGSCFLVLAGIPHQVLGSGERRCLGRRSSSVLENPDCATDVDTHANYY